MIFNNCVRNMVSLHSFSYFFGEKVYYYARRLCGIAFFPFNLAMEPRNVLLLSTSTVHGTEYLQYAKDELNNFLKTHGVSRILFVPYAMWDHEAYAGKIKSAFEEWGYEIRSIHNETDPVAAVNEAQCFYVGGGNTFQLLKALYDNKLLEPLRKRVCEGTPYIGSSAGTNVATISINTTNDMPIVYPPSLEALGLVPFNINPHYQDPDPNGTHMGETREERISQYHEIPGSPPVLGMREGCMLLVQGRSAHLKGICGARLFQPGKAPVECPSGTDVSFLLNAK